ncbi:hypothetical protein GOODEAATRI_005541 [Goodea atripinnis]|uniref:Uncharacterized protein n=1 Tax=Goodea atripinnis TaxID=208336 RepID=A0ABV0PLM5_9TELE
MLIEGRGTPPGCYNGVFLDSEITQPRGQRQHFNSLLRYTDRGRTGTRTGAGGQAQDLSEGEGQRLINTLGGIGDNVTEFLDADLQELSSWKDRGEISPFSTVA